MKFLKSPLVIFSNKNYLLLNLLLTTVIALLMSILLQFIFIYPKFSLYIPQSEEINLAFLVIFTLLSSSSITMSIYMYRKCSSHLISRSGPGLFGTFIGMAATACTCSFVIAPLILAGGSIASTIAAFLSAYIVPLRILSLLLLSFSIFVVMKNFDKACTV